jgi:tetratricopeptide (TPR) repeat protein
LEVLSSCAEQVLPDLGAATGPPVFVVDTSVVLSYVSPRSRPTQPRFGADFWSDPDVIEGAISWFFSQAKYPRVLLPPYEVEVERFLKEPGWMTDSRGRHQVTYGTEVEQLAAHESKLADLADRIGNFDPQRSSYTEITMRLRQALHDGTDLLAELTAYRRRAAMKWWSIERYHEMVDSAVLVGLPWLLHRLGIRPPLNISRQIREDLLQFLNGKRVTQTYRNQADAEAFALYAAVRAHSDGDTPILFLTDLELFGDYVRDLASEGGHELPQLAVRPPAYLGLVLAVVGGTGWITSDASRAKLEAAIARWRRMTSDLKSVARELQAIAVAQDEAPSVLPGAETVLLRAQHQANEVKRLFNDLRAQCSYAGLAEALQERTRGLSELLSRDESLLAHAGQVVETLARVSQGLDEGMSSPAEVWDKLKIIAPAVETLRATVQDLYGSLNRTDQEGDERLQQVHERLYQTRARLQEKGTELPDGLRRIVEHALLGRLDRPRLLQAWRDLETAAALGSEQDLRLTRALLSLASWPYGASDQEGQGRADLERGIKREIEALLSQHHAQVSDSANCALAQYYYMRSDFAMAIDYFGRSGSWSRNPLCVLRWANAIFNSAKDKQDRSEEIEKAVRVIDSVSYQGDDTIRRLWRAALRNSRIYFEIHNPELLPSDLREKAAELREIIVEVDAEIKKGAVVAPADTASLYDTLGRTYYCLAKKVAGSEQDEAVRNGREAYRHAIELDEDHRTAREGLGDFELLVSSGTSSDRS